jgi:Transcriptional regulators containing a DNA-binding HTH domain and an aminotransferase domain (MocR family) and their eukaryotic orthologs
MRKLYSDRRDFFIEQFNKLLSDYFVLEVPEAGLHFVAWLRRKTIYRSSRGFARKSVSGHRRYPHVS